MSTEPRYRIALAGLACECCTFSPLRSEVADFAITTGPDLVDSEIGRHFTAGLANSVLLGGWIGRALPGGPVATSAYATMRDDLLAGIANCGDIDGIVLDLHGALAVDGLDDAESDLLAAIRVKFGSDLPITAAMDLHGNISQALVDQLDALSAYRTAPHVDVAATRKRAAALLEQRLAGWQPSKSWAGVPALLTGEQTSTEFEPGKSLWQLVEQVNQRPGVHDAALFVGYAWSDEPRTGASATCYADDASVAAEVTQELVEAYWQRREQFTCPVPIMKPDEAMAWASKQQNTPVVISDAADNPTAGGCGDVSTMLAAALAQNMPSCLIAGLVDAPATQAALEAGSGNSIEISLGATLAPQLSDPTSGVFEVLSAHADDGAGACTTLRSGGVVIACTQKRRTFHRLADFARLEIDPASFGVIVVKLGYLEPEIKALAKTHCMASGPGCVPPDISSLSHSRAKRDYP